MGIINMKWNDQGSGAHPTDDISIEFEIRPKFGML